MITIEQIKKLSPVKIVHQENLDSWGRYNHVDKYVEIVGTLGNLLYKIVLLHEIGHAICDKNNCRCYGTNDRKLREYHAFKFVLIHVKNDKRLSKMFIDESNNLVLNDFWPDHQHAIIRLKKLKTWKRLLC